MKHLSLLNPFRIRDVVRRIRDAAGGGGPKVIRLAGISDPDGWLATTSRVKLEVVGRDGRVTKFEPRVPVPFPYTWAYRIARRLGVPLVSDVDPERLRLGIPVPGR